MTARSKKPSHPWEEMTLEEKVKSYIDFFNGLWVDSNTAEQPDKPLSLREKYNKKITKERKTGFYCLLLAILFFMLFTAVGASSFGEFIMMAILVLIPVILSAAIMETASNWSKQGWDIDCRCGRHIPRTTAWICGRCDHVNDPHHYSHSPERVPHLLYQCARCKWAPSAILCPECKTPFRLGPERVFRPAKVFIPLPKEVEEIARIKRQHEEKKEKLRQQYEIERFERSLRNETILLDLEELVQRVKGGKQFEKAALKMIEDLKADGYLTPKQEAMIVEFIEDKVLEAIHVDRRGGQSRHRPE